jgi:hypothetical protein
MYSLRREAPKSPLCSLRHIFTDNSLCDLLLIHLVSFLVHFIISSKAIYFVYVFDLSILYYRLFACGKVH